MSSLTIGPVEIHPLKYEVYVRGQPVRLTRKEFGVLVVLTEAQGTVLTREELLDQVWGPDVFVEPAAVTIAISRLKRKLGDAAWIIKTVYGVGYKTSEQPCS